jgi:hypothetical protein
MFVILIAAASLITQAYVFRDIENSESNLEVNTLDRYAADAREDAEYRWPAESDSSRTAGPLGGR